MTSLRGALNLEVPSERLLRIHGDRLHQQPLIHWHGRGIGPIAPAQGAQGAQGAAAGPAPDQADQADYPMVDCLEGHGPTGRPEVEPMDAGVENDPLKLLGDGHGRQSPRKKHGEAMKEGEPNGEPNGEPSGGSDQSK